MYAIGIAASGIRSGFRRPYLSRLPPPVSWRRSPFRKGERRPGEAELTDTAEEIGRELAAGVEVRGSPRHLPLGKASHDLADPDLLVAEPEVHRRPRLDGIRLFPFAPDVGRASSPRTR